MNEQQRLLMLIWSDDATLLAESGFDKRGIDIYRRNLLANAQRALSITYPTIFALLDSDVSDNLVTQFLKLCPPVQGDWTQWGEEFSDFIAVDQVATDYPYLPDCASLDWLIHSALHGKDQTLDQTSLQLLANIDPKKIVFSFNKNVALIKTCYPIDSIFEAHHNNDPLQRDSAMQQAQSALSKELKQQVIMVCRPEYQPQVIKLSDSEATFIACLKSGNALSTALDLVSQATDFSFENWLMAAIARNLIVMLYVNESV